MVCETNSKNGDCDCFQQNEFQYQCYGTLKSPGESITLHSISLVHLCSVFTILHATVNTNRFISVIFDTPFIYFGTGKMKETFKNTL